MIVSKALKRTSLFLFAFTLFLSHLCTCLAALPDFFRTLNPLISATIGVGESIIGQSQLLSNSDDLTKYYYNAHNKHSNRLISAAFLGTQIPVNSKWALDIGLRYYQASPFLNQGILIQGVDDLSSDIFPYHYKVRSRQILIEAKLLRKIGKIYPFISLGIGEASNRSYDYWANVPPFLTFTPKFSDHTNKAFSYSVAVGFDIAIHSHLRAGVSYRFSDLGKARLGTGYIDTRPFSNTLSQSHIYLNQLMFQLTYLFR